MCSARGEGVGRDAGVAVWLYAKADNAGPAGGNVHFGVLEEHGEGVE